MTLRRYDVTHDVTHHNVRGVILSALDLPKTTFLKDKLTHSSKTPTFQVHLTTKVLNINIRWKNVFKWCSFFGLDSSFLQLSHLTPHLPIEKTGRDCQACKIFISTHSQSEFLFTCSGRCKRDMRALSGQIQELSQLDLHGSGGIFKVVLYLDSPPCVYFWHAVCGCCRAPPADFNACAQKKEKLTHARPVCPSHLRALPVAT